MSLFDFEKSFQKWFWYFKLFKLLYLYGEMKSSDLLKVIWKDWILLMELEFFYLKLGI